jgi:hypothetical protein
MNTVPIDPSRTLCSIPNVSYGILDLGYSIRSDVREGAYLDITYPIITNLIDEIRPDL